MFVVSRRPTAGLAFAFALAPVLVAGAAHAEPKPHERALATALFREAKELMDRGEIAPACDKFAESQRLDPSGGTVLNLAVCREKQGRTASAWAALSEALSIAKQTGNEKRIAFAEERLRMLEPRLSHVTVHVDTDQEALAITIDGAPIGRAAWNTRVPIDPGTHVIAASAPRKKPWSVRIDIAGDAKHETVAVPALEDAPPPPPTVTPPSSVVGPVPAAPRHVESRPASPASWGIASGGLGLAMAFAGTFLGLRAFDLRADSDARCPDGLCSTEGARSMSRAQTFADLSTGAFVIGAVAIGAGVYLFVTGKPRVRF